MPDEGALSPLESEDSYKYDLQTVGYRQRTATAVNQFRSQHNPSDFEPAPSEPSPDPSPTPDESGVSPMESNQIGFYEGVIQQTHRPKTATQVTKFSQHLLDFVQTYESSTGRHYTMPQSAVTDLDVEDDGNEDRLASNVVGAYDLASAGYGLISSGEAANAASESNGYEDTLDDALEGLDTLNGNGNGSVKKSLENAGQFYDDTYGKRRTNPPANRADKSVLEATDSDTADATSTWQTTVNNFKRDSYDPAVTSIETAIENIPTEVGNRIKDITEI